MATLALDGDLDLLDSTSLPVYTGVDELSQRIQNCMCLLVGESCSFPDAGVNWLSQQFTQRASLPAIRSILRAKILQIQGVSSISSFSCEVQPDRGLVCSVTVVADDGLTVSGTFNGLT